MECIISRFDNSVEILKSSATYNFAWQKSGGAMLPPAPPQFCRAWRCTYLRYIYVEWSCGKTPVFTFKPWKFLNPRALSNYFAALSVEASNIPNYTNVYNTLKHAIQKGCILPPRYLWHEDNPGCLKLYIGRSFHFTLYSRHQIDDLSLLRTKVIFTSVKKEG